MTIRDAAKALSERMNDRIGPDSVVSLILTGRLGTYGHDCGQNTSFRKIARLAGKGMR